MAECDCTPQGLGCTGADGGTPSGDQKACQKTPCPEPQGCLYQPDCEDSCDCGCGTCG